MKIELTENQLLALSVLLFSYESKRQVVKVGKDTYVEIGTSCFLPTTDRALRRLNKKINEDLYK